MISVAGIRAVVGESLRPEQFFRFILAFGTLVQGKTVVVGSDSRLSRDMMRHMVFGGLTSCGCRIIDIGLAATPTVGLTTRRLGAGGGIAITASHNPAEWNALKFFGPDGTFLNADQNRELQAIERDGSFRRATLSELGHVEQDTSAIEQHIDLVASSVDAAAIRARKFRVVVDCVNGVGRLGLEPLFEKLGVEATWLFTDVHAPFPHNPEPLPENLTALCAKVKEIGADLGFAVDPDADRLAIVDGTGRAVGEERTLVLAAMGVLASGKRGPLVVNLSTTRALDDVARRFDVPVFRTPIGEAHVVGRMKSEKALIGGEGNGGVIYPLIHSGRDAATGTALILAALAAAPAGSTLADLNAQVPDYAMVKTKVDRAGLELDDLVAKMRAEFADATALVTDDGVKAEFADRWVHLRLSGTEPIIRVFAEGPTKEAAEELIARVRAKVMPNPS